MSVFGKVTFGLAVAGLLVGQSAFAAAPRAADPRLGNASTGQSVGFRQSTKVARKNKDGSEVLIAALTLIPVVGGAAIIAGADGGNNGGDTPASP